MTSSELRMAVPDWRVSVRAAPLTATPEGAS